MSRAYEEFSGWSRIRIIKGHYFALDKRGWRGAQEIDLNLPDTLIPLWEWDVLLKGPRKRWSICARRLKEWPLPSRRTRPVVLLMFNDAGFDLILNDVEKRRCPGSQFSSHDEGEIVWNIVCVVVILNCEQS